MSLWAHFLRFPLILRKDSLTRHARTHARTRCRSLCVHTLRHRREVGTLCLLYNVWHCRTHFLRGCVPSRPRDHSITRYNVLAHSESLELFSSRTRWFFVRRCKSAWKRRLAIFFKSSARNTFERAVNRAFLSSWLARLISTTINFYDGINFKGLELSFRLWLQSFELMFLTKLIQTLTLYIN